MRNHELFQKDNIYATPEFWEEFDDFFQQSANRARNKVKFLALLSMLSETKSISNLCKSDNFEKLTDTSLSLYVMKIKTKDNLRIIFSYNRDGSILLLLFAEKSGKRRTDYSGAIPKAIKRLNAFTGGKHGKKGN